MTFQFITLFQRQGALDPISPTPLPGCREGNSHPTLLIRFANSWTSSVFPHQSPRATKRAQKGCLRSWGSFQAGDAVVAVQLLGHVQLFVTPRTAARQASCPSPSPGACSNTSIELVMPSNHLILCHPLLLLPSIFPSIRGFSNESALCTRWSKYQSSNFNISPSIEYSGLISFRIDW